LRNQKREAEKKIKLEELYEKHDRKALEMKDLITTQIPGGSKKPGENGETSTAVQEMENAAY
jgi:hypothetical protein